MASSTVRTKRDRLKQLRAFCAAAGFENITRAADRLSVTQRAVALQVRSLEDELGTGLFERRGPRLALTQAGRRLYQLAQPLVEDLDSLAEDFAEKRRELVSAHIEVAVAPVASEALPGMVSRHQDDHPRVRIRVTHCPIRDALRHLADGRVDLVIGPGVGGTDFAYRPLFRYELLFATSEDHPLAGRHRLGVEDARGFPAIMPTAGTYGAHFEDAVGSRLSVAARVAVESSGWGVMKSFVRAGNGISVIPSCCIDETDRLRGVAIDGHANGHACGVFARQSVVGPVRDFIRSLEPEKIQ